MPGHQKTAGTNYEVIVIGGGPAGSSAAAVLAQRGHAVLLLEKLRFPRFHIGESLIPFMAKQLELMNLLDKVEQQNFIKKFGLEFTSEQGGFQRVDFTAQGAGRKLYAYQVERAVFDDIMLKQAKDVGVEVIEEAVVKNLIFDNGKIIGLEYEHEGITKAVDARFVIDASGRAGKIANHFKWRIPNERLKKIAVFKHFHGLDEANNPGWPGDTQLGYHKDGWVWAIPTSDDTISIGILTSPELVKQATSLEEIFEAHYTRIPRIIQRLKGTTPIREAKAETDYCYHVNKVTGPNYMLVGDAGCFVDPIFSAGAYLAILTSIQAAKTLDMVLNKQDSVENAMNYYERFYKTGYDCNFRLAYAFYENDQDWGKFLLNNRDKIEERHMSRALGGDFWNPYNSITRYLRTERKWDTFEPFEFAYGCPVYPELEAREALEQRWLPERVL